jgi:HEAT repeat protein
MEEKTRRMITWVVVGSLVAIIAAFAISRKTELDRMADRIAFGSPAEQLAATERLVHKQKALEALDERPRWVQDRAILAISRIGSYEAFWEAAGTVGVLDDPPQAQLREAMRKQGEVVLDLLVEAIQDKDGNRRGCCAAPLGLIGQPAIDPLADLMSAWDQYVRDIVRDQLHVIVTAIDGERKSAANLVDIRQQWLEEYEAIAAETNAPEDIRQVEAQRDKIREAQEALEAVPETNIVDDLLMDILKEPPPSAEEKQQAAEYLRRVSTAKATIIKTKVPVIPAMIDQLLTDPQPDVRATGCELLGQAGNQTYSLNGDVVGAPLAAAEAAKMVEPLLKRLQRDPEWTVRRKAAIALGRLQLVAMDEGATRPLIEALDHPRADVKAAAAQALGMIAAARPFDTAELEWTETGPNDTAKAAAAPLAMTLRTKRRGAAGELAVALEKVGTPAIPHLIPALDHPDQEVRLLATQTIAGIGSTAAVEPLAKVLADEDVSVRQTAANALRSLATRDVIPQLIQALGDDDWKVYYAAKDALARLADAAVPQLVEALRSESARVSYTAEQALADIGGPAVDPLVVSLSSDDPQVLKWVSIALGDIGYDAVRPAARVLRSHAKPSARAAAARALGRSDQVDAVEPLIEAAEDGSPEVRMAVASALVQLGQEEATPTLMGLLQDDQNRVRAATMERLFEWYDPPAVPALARLLESSDQDVRQRAAILLAEHVGGQEELRAAVASAITAGEAHDVHRSTMDEISDAADELQKPGGKHTEAKATLDRHLGSADPGPKYAAVVGVSTVVNKPATKAIGDWALGILEKMLKDDDDEIQQTAAVAVAQTEVPGILENAVSDAAIRPDIQRAVIEALGLLGTGESIDALLPLCRSGPTETRMRAARALGNIGRRISTATEGKDPKVEEAAKSLIALASEAPSDELRAKFGVAVAVIGEGAVPSAIEYLLDAPDDEKPFAAAILGKLGNVAVDPYLLRSRNQLRGQPGKEEPREWLAVALYVTGDKMARDYVSALAQDEKPSEELIKKAEAELTKLLDAA